MNENASLSTRLRQNGQEITKIGTSKEILVPHGSNPDTGTAHTFMNLLFALMQKDDFRHELHDWGYAQKEPSKDVDAYLKLLKCFDKTLAKNLNDKVKVREGQYNATFEWFTKELLLKKFGAKAAEFGVHLQDVPEDEFDCIAVTDNGLVYVECGAGQNKSLFSPKTLNAFTKRDGFLEANYSFFLFDREEVFGGVDPGTFTTSQAQSYGLFKIRRITRLIQESPKDIFYYVQPLHGSRWFLAASLYKNPQRTLRDMLMYAYLQSDSAWMRHFRMDEIRWVDQ